MRLFYVATVQYNKPHYYILQENGTDKLYYIKRGQISHY